MSLVGLTIDLTGCRSKGLVDSGTCPVSLRQLRSLSAQLSVCLVTAFVETSSLSSIHAIFRLDCV